MANSENAPAYTRFPWAKSDRKDPRRIHLLEHHMADVGACFEALLSQPTIRQRLACSGGLDSLDDATAARLALFAALHDIGKVNTGFQAQIWRDGDLPPGQRKPRRAGHTLDLVPVLKGDDTATAKWFFESLGWWDDATVSWDDRDGETFCGLFIAALSHHGLPVQLEGKRSPNPGIWRAYNGLEPREYVRHVGDLARRWFPAAWQPGALPLPSAPPFQHAFLGLCILADWIGSNEVWFPFCDEPRDDYMDKARERAESAIKAIGLDLHEQRRSFAGTPGFGELFPHVGRPPNAIQQAAAQGAPIDERLVIIESETGSGKTEAALWRFARMYEEGLVDGLYFALPTRAAAVQIHERVKHFADRLFGEQDRPPVVLAVPGYDADADGDLVALDYDSSAAGQHDAMMPWASESPKRYLAAQIAVGTVDQAMMGALKVKHAHMRAACLARNLLVVDEVHASDTYMRRILKALLDAHLGTGGYALLMSATLGSAARRQWLSPGHLSLDDAPPLAEAIDAPYPAVSVTSTNGERVDGVGGNNREKNVGVTATPLMGDFDAAAELALDAARAGAKVLVIRNTVDYAIDTQRAVEEAASGSDRALLFALGDTLTLHHGRFAAGDRRLLDRAVEAWLGKDRAPGGGAIVVGTQTLEQSLDIDADLLITDLCPADVLLQRIGRLHRHSHHARPAGYETPSCVVLTPNGDDLSPLLKSPINGLGGYVYEDLRILEATRRLIDEFPQWDIPAMNRELVEKTTHPEALERIVEERGDSWRIHANHIQGGMLAEGLTAQNAIIQRDKSFFIDNHDVLFGTAEERIRTRLGDEGLDMELTPPLSSPFDSGGRIDRIAVPVRWLAGAEVDGPVAPSTLEGGFTFAIGDRSFRYDRRGLRRAT